MGAQRYFNKKKYLDYVNRILDLDIPILAVFKYVPKIHIDQFNADEKKSSKSYLIESLIEYKDIYDHCSDFEFIQWLDKRTLNWQKEEWEIISSLNSLIQTQKEDTQKRIEANKEILLTFLGYNQQLIKLIRDDIVLESLKDSLQSEDEVDINIPSAEIVIKPKFKPEALQNIFILLKDFFSEEHQILFKQILETGNDTSEQLIFKDCGNRLADAFKQLYVTDFITGCQKKELENWIYSNFKYMRRGKVKLFTLRYLNDIISTGKDKCQRPVINIKLDKSSGFYKIEKA